MSAGFLTPFKKFKLFSYVMTDVVILINKKYYRHFWICFTLGSLESQAVFLHINCNAEVQDQEKYFFHCSVLYIQSWKENPCFKERNGFFFVAIFRKCWLSTSVPTFMCWVAVLVSLVPQLDHLFTCSYLLVPCLFPCFWLVSPVSCFFK